MSQNFLKVKRKLIADMKNTPFHTQKSWCDIMLKAASRCNSDQDQKDFFRFILNPDDSWDIAEPTFMTVDAEAEILIKSVETLPLVNTDNDNDEKQTEYTVENCIRTNGNTTYITVTPT